MHWVRICAHSSVSHCADTELSNIVPAINSAYSDSRDVLSIWTALLQGAVRL